MSAATPIEIGLQIGKADQETSALDLFIKRIKMYSKLTKNLNLNFDPTFEMSYMDADWAPMINLTGLAPF